MIPIPCSYCGMQEYPGSHPFALWTLLFGIQGHPAGSTVSEATLHNLGYVPHSITPRTPREEQP